MDTPAPEALADIQLEWAYSWKCPECHKKNFSAKVAVEFLDNDLRDALGMDPCEPLTADHYELAKDTFMCPAFVRCSRCKNLYRAQGPEDLTELLDDDEDEYDEDELEEGDEE